MGGRREPEEGAGLQVVVSGQRDGGGGVGAENTAAAQQQTASRGLSGPTCIAEAAGSPEGPCSGVSSTCEHARGDAGVRDPRPHGGRTVRPPPRLPSLSEHLCSPWCLPAPHPLPGLGHPP